MGFHELYQKKQARMIVFGITISFLSAMLCIVLQNFNVAATSAIEGTLEESVLATFFMSIMTIGTSEILAGILTIIYNVIRGVPIAEVGRTWKVRSGRMIIVSAIVAGPLASGCSVVAISMCGSTYANCIIGLAPVVAAFLSFVFLKEKVSKRVWVGIVISLTGVIIACNGAPESASNFWLGIAIACVAPFGFALEGVISTHSLDVTDAMISAPMYRMIISGVMQIALASVIGIATGHASWVGDLFNAILSSPLCLGMMIATAISIALQYTTGYCAYTFCGAARAEAIICTGSIWSIPVGFVMQAAGILPYTVTMFGIIGALIVGIGIIMVVAKPSELFSIRTEE